MIDAVHIIVHDPPPFSLFSIVPFHSAHEGMYLSNIKHRVKMHFIYCKQINKPFIEAGFVYSWVCFDPRSHKIDQVSCFFNQQFADAVAIYLILSPIEQ